MFPGGIIPSIRAIADNLAAHTSLWIVERRDLGPHYAHTLALWRERFLANWASLEGSFDDTFRRMWEFYLAYCEAGFRVGLPGRQPARAGPVPVRHGLRHGCHPVDRRLMQLEGARIWVTGASSGIGAALARELADRGASVAISARNADKLREVAGDRMHVVPVDVTDRDAVLAAGDAVRAALGEIDVAVLNAGTWSQFDVEKWDSAAFAGAPADQPDGHGAHARGRRPDDAGAEARPDRGHRLGGRLPRASPEGRPTARRRRRC